MFKLNKLVAVLAVACFVGFGSTSYAQDGGSSTKTTASKKSKIKIVRIKDGKKEVIEHEFEGEMPESIKKEIEQMNTEGIETIDIKTSGDGKSPRHVINVSEMIDVDVEGIKGHVKVLNDNVNIIIGNDSLGSAEGHPRIMFKTFDGGENFLFKDSLGKCNMQIMKDGLKKVKIELKNLKELKELKDFEKMNIDLEKANIDLEKMYIDVEKANIDREKMYINLNQMAEELGQLAHIRMDSMKSCIFQNEFIFVPKDGTDARVLELQKDGAELEKFESKEGNTVYMLKNKAGDMERNVSVIIINKSKKEDKPTKTSKNSADSENLLKEDNIKGLNNFLVYPNPSDGNFTLNFDVKKKTTLAVSVLDINGKEVFAERLEGFTGSYNRKISLPIGTPGTYIIKISEGKKVRSQKIVVQ